MAIRKNKKFIDPRYFMDEKTETINEAWDSAGKWKSRYSDGRSKSSDAEPETDSDRKARRAKEAREDARRREDGLPPIKSKYFEENVGEEDLEEGFENVTPENIQIVADAFKQVAINFAPAIIIPALVLLYNELKQKKTDKE